MLESLTHMRDAAMRQADIAGEMYKPSFGFEVSYGFRQGQDMGGAQRPDMLTAMFTFDLPLFTRARQDREAGAARSRARAADARRTDAARELEAMLRSAPSRAPRLQDVGSLYEKQLERMRGRLRRCRARRLPVERRLARGRRRHAAARLREVRDRHAKARAEQAVALAEIDYLAGDQP